MNLFKKIKKDYLDLSSNVRNGLVILVILMFISVLVPYIYKAFFKTPLAPLSQKEIMQFDSVYQLLSDTVIAGAAKTKEIQYFSFNPNRIAAQDWQKLGIPEKVAQRIEKYVQHGGKFRKKEDLLKIYGFDPLWLTKLQPYIQLNDFPQTKLPDIKETRPKAASQIYFKKTLLELNSADSAQLEALPEIGGVFASRILKYRKMLGGFYSKKQLSEVYGLRPETIEKIEPLLIIDTSLIIRIDLHNSNFQQLKSHPYIGKKKTESILKLKKYVPNFREIDLLENEIFGNDELSKLRPYLK